MNKAFSIAMLVAGVMLIIFGVNASNSFGSSVSKAVTGAPTNSAVWMLVGGVVLAIVGFVMTLRGRNS